VTNVTTDQCDKRHSRSGMWLRVVMTALAAMIAVMLAVAGIGYSASERASEIDAKFKTHVEVQANETRHLNAALDRMEIRQEENRVNIELILRKVNGGK